MAVLFLLFIYSPGRREEGTKGRKEGLSSARSSGRRRVRPVRRVILHSPPQRLSPLEPCFVLGLSLSVSYSACIWSLPLKNIFPAS